MAALIETCKLNGVESFADLCDVLAKIANSWPMSRIDDLPPWANITPMQDVA